jgi:hypothetical protein
MEVAEIDARVVRPHARERKQLVGLMKAAHEEVEERSIRGNHISMQKGRHLHVLLGRERNKVVQGIDNALALVGLIRSNVHGVTLPGQLVEVRLGMASTVDIEKDPRALREVPPEQRGGAQRLLHVGVAIHQERVADSRHLAHEYHVQIPIALSASGASSALFEKV